MVNNTPQPNAPQPDAATPQQPPQPFSLWSVLGALGIGALGLTGGWGLGLLGLVGGFLGGKVVENVLPKAASADTNANGPGAGGAAAGAPAQGADASATGEAAKKGLQNAGNALMGSPDPANTPTDYGHQIAPMGNSSLATAGLATGTLGVAAFGGHKANVFFDNTVNKLLEPRGRKLNFKGNLLPGLWKTDAQKGLDALEKYKLRSSATGEPPTPQEMKLFKAALDERAVLANKSLTKAAEIEQLVEANDPARPSLGKRISNLSVPEGRPAIDAKVKGVNADATTQGHLAETMEKLSKEPKGSVGRTFYEDFMWGDKNTVNRAIEVAKAYEHSPGGIPRTDVTQTLTTELLAGRAERTTPVMEQVGEMGKNLGRANVFMGGLNAISDVSQGDYVGATGDSLQASLGLMAEVMPVKVGPLAIAATTVSGLTSATKTWNETHDVGQTAAAGGKSAATVGGMAAGTYLAPTVVGGATELAANGLTYAGVAGLDSAALGATAAAGTTATVAAVSTVGLVAGTALAGWTVGTIANEKLGISKGTTNYLYGGVEDEMAKIGTSSSMKQKDGAGLAVINADQNKELFEIVTRSSDAYLPSKNAELEALGIKRWQDPTYIREKLKEAQAQADSTGSGNLFGGFLQTVGWADSKEKLLAEDKVGTANIQLNAYEMQFNKWKSGLGVGQNAGQPAASGNLIPQAGLPNLQNNTQQR